MKSMLVIGMGRFGARLANRLSELDNDVMILDKDEKKIEPLTNICTDAQIGDCTNIEVLKSLGIRNFDICFVTIGDNFQSSLEITSLLKELGAKYVISKASTEIQRKFLLRNGADEVIYPDKEATERLAIRVSANKMFDFLTISKNYSISETPIPNGWVGKSVSELDVRRKNHINILAVKKNDSVLPILSPDYCFSSDEHIIVSGKIDDLMRFSSKL